ncbi:hypothetical protein KW846_02680 [Pseudomonas sp. PDM32]|uniref:hypothetical protein n=1 Tax=Pseudomonas sp. PDM32 TaxID=2854768 RepID=UPI001C455FC2|nr:hypothetical protein [Pseudomonas sp. PDM32]MBV7571598.1 hypothetical protein [Pseudomonas sp. PDM32]
MNKKNGFKLIIEGQEDTQAQLFTEDAVALSIRPGDKLRSGDGMRLYEVLEKRYIVDHGTFIFDGVVSRQIYP